jgi:hypothetical protein
MVTRMWRLNPAANARFSAFAVRRCAVLLAVVAGIAGCESNSAPPGPYAVVSKYLNQIAEGNYSNACGMLDSGTRDALTRKLGSRTTCSHLFVRCLPSNALNINRDQSQLLYANVQVVTHRKKADVKVGGTAVARAIREVTVAKERGTWKLTSFGEALTHCQLKQHRLRAARRSPRATVG